MLTFIQTAEGRVTKSGSVWTYEYNLRDHLGNVRVSFDKHPSTGVARLIQKDDYYPFGLTFNSYALSPQNLYKFQGQEEQEETGWVQFKWRNHDPTIGRFFNVDPLAEDYVHNSPYAFSENKVTAHIELEGLESWFAADGNVLHGPRSDKNIKELGLKTAQAASTHAGYVGVRTQQVRKSYHAKVSNLNQTDGRARSQIKMDAREKLPALTREISEKMRPIADESARTLGTANKSNTTVNSKAEALGKIGKIGLGVSTMISVYNVTTSEDKGQKIMSESGGVLGAIAGGELGAIGGVWGASIGGLIGAIAGAFVGSTTIEGSMTNLSSQNNCTIDSQYLMPKDATDRIKVNIPKID